MRDLIELYGAAIAAWGLAAALLLILIHLSFAIGVWRDASDRTVRGYDTVFVGRFCWMCTTLVGGPFTAGLYWVMHHSSLAPPPAGPVQIKCPYCEIEQKVPASAVGLVRFCRGCLRAIRIPKPDADADPHDETTDESS